MVNIPESEAHKALRAIDQKQGDFGDKVREIVEYNRTHPDNPITVRVGDIVDGLFVVVCAHSLRSESQSSHRDQLIRDFRDSLSRTAQIIFDVHIMSEEVFLGSFGS